MLSASTCVKLESPPDAPPLAAPPEVLPLDPLDDPREPAPLPVPVEPEAPPLAPPLTLPPLLLPGDELPELLPP